MRRFRLLLFVVLFLHPLHAARPAAIEEREIPFEIRDGLLWVEVMLAPGQPALSFLFDTGASVTVLDAAHWPGRTRRSRPVLVEGIGGHAAGLWPVRWNATIAGVPLPERVLGLDLAELSAACGRSVDGLIGADFIEGKVLRFDFQQKVITLLPPDSFPAEEGVEEIRLKRTAGAFLAPLRVNGSAAGWFRLDTGCASGLHWVNRAAAAAADTRAQTTGVGIADLALTTVNARLGSRALPGIEAVIHRSPIFRGEGGLLGNGVLTNYSVTLDAKRSRLFLAEPLP